MAMLLGQMAAAIANSRNSRKHRHYQNEQDALSNRTHRAWRTRADRSGIHQAQRPCQAGSQSRGSACRPVVFLQAPCIRVIVCRPHRSTGCFNLCEHAPIGLCALTVMAASLAGYGALYVWRGRTEYDATTIHSYAMFGKPGQFALRDFTRAGPISWRGNEFERGTGDKIYVNSYQTGAADLLDLLQRQVKETYYE
jgi:hypothetical protein